LSENLPTLQVVREWTLHDLLAYVPGANPRGRQDPRMRPDFVVMKGNKTIAILDAKYRDLWNESLPREMLYQLALYALTRPAGGEAVILYPTTADDAVDARIEVREPVGGAGRAFVVLRPVHLPTLRDLLDQGRVGSAQRQRLALGLVAGFH
jgi:5-methylcytosine-specific restriction enzyme subunit McrC